VYLGTIPLLMSNHSDNFNEIIPLHITEFLMGIESVVTKAIPYDLISVVVRALNMKAVVLGSNPGMIKLI
jgi:hypothetical protein